jgi:hypothetical protein
LRVAAWITLSALFAFCGCLPSAAFAGEHGDGEASKTGDVKGQSGAVWTGTTWKVWTGTPGGAANTAESSPPGTLIYSYPAVIQNRWCGGDVPDSSSTYPATGATRWYLDLSATFHATLIDSQAVYIVGLQVRNSSTGANDTLTVTGLLANGNAGAADSIGSIPRTINQVIGQAGKCLPSERVLVLGGQPGSRAFRIALYSPNTGWWNGDNIGIRLRPVAGALTSGTLITSSIPCVTWAATLRGYR